MSRVIGDPGEIVDELGDTPKRPQRRLETVGLRSQEQCLDNLLLLLWRQTRGLSRHLRLQSLGSLFFPDLEPVTDTGATDVQASGDLGIGEICLEELGRLHPPLLVTFIAFLDGCVHNTLSYETHPTMLPVKPKGEGQ